MRETIKDWQEEWIETNGKTNELEVLIENISLGEYSPCIYEGSFVDIPAELYEKKVIEWGQVIDSSEPERIGAYTLTIRECN